MSVELEYARKLAYSLWQRHYRETAPQWEPCSDLMGLLTQIDNMASGLCRYDDAERAGVGVDALPHTDAVINALQWELAIRCFIVPVRIISESFMAATTNLSPRADSAGGA